jgi:serine/threonine-protein kinase
MRGAIPGPSDPASSDDGAAETLDASASITPDPFLAEVARIPLRSLPVADPPLRAGEVFGHFIINAELGRGGMGVVYAAEDQTLGRTVALKMLPASDDEGRRKRFLREARAAAGLTHPGIAIIFEIGEVAGRAFIAMELVRGRTLRARLHEGPLPLAEALRIARKIAGALARAHEKGVIHRDLKPENVMLADDGEIKLLDFGLAKPIVSGDSELGTATTATEHGRLLGTPMYMSPEQAKGWAIDAGSDVFSFGVMLYEMLTGRRPFVAPTVVELFIALDRDEPLPPSRLAPRVSAAAERVVLRCLRKDPKERYPDGAALARELEAVPAPAAPRRRLGGLAAVLAAGAVVVVVAAGAMRSGPSASAVPVAPTAVTDLPAPRSPSAEAVAAYRAGLTISRDGAAPGKGFVRAVELDPDLAAAHVQLASCVMGHELTSAREHFRAAQAHRADLTPRDQAMLDAFEPLVHRQPADWAESNRRLQAAVARYPGDAQLWHLLALGRANWDDFEAAVADQRRALALDPGYASAQASLAMALAYLGRFDEARAAADQCLVASPASLGCLSIIAELEHTRGACDAMEGTARRIIAAGSPPHASYALLAQALAARGASLTSVRESLHQSELGLAEVPAGLLPEIERTRRRLGTQSALAALTGDFDAALRVAGEIDKTLVESRQQSEHGMHAAWVAQVYLEIGRDADAGLVALDFLDRRDAWEPAPSAEDVAMGADATPFLLRTARRTGAITRADFEARREAWRRSWAARMTPVTTNFLWLHGYAAMVDGPADARAAMDALPRFSPLPPFRPAARVDLDVGRAFLLAGRVDEALTWLERAAARCDILWDGLEHVQTVLALGDARAAHGDKPGACAAYGEVTTRWAEARPRSLSAERARAAAEALGCGR